MDRQTMSVEDAARMLGISRDLAYRLARRGELPAIRLGHRLLVSRSALERMLTCAGDKREEVSA